MRRFLCLVIFLAASLVCGKDFTITFLHTNDSHAHIEQTVTRDWTLGGSARQATLIKKFRKDDPNVILLNAGDVFQGTLYFNVYFGLADLAYMNAVGFDAMALGNHEFDKGTGVLADFVKRATFPVLSANIDVSNDLGLKNFVKPSTILTVGGHRVGVVGGIVPNLETISSPGPTVKMKDLRTSVQAEIDSLNKQGIKIIVLLTHIGYEEDQSLAKSLHGVDVVVGGHSHSLLGDIDVKNPPRRGGYPTVVTDGDGRKVLIVQAWEWGKVLGRLQVTFDAKGEVKRWVGAPVPVEATIQEDSGIASMVAAFLKPIEGLRNQPIGELSTTLSRDGESGNVPMGQVIADGMLAATKSSGAVVAFMNGGGVRATLEPGKVTYGDWIGVQPFGNTLVLLEVTGAELRAAIEHSVRGQGSILIPSKGFEVTVNRAAASGHRATAIRVNGVELVDSQTYKICLNSFVAGGGDGFAMLRDSKGVRYDTGIVDLDATLEFFKSQVPVRFLAETRIKG